MRELDNGWIWDHRMLKFFTIVKPDGYFLKQDRKFGCLIFEELKRGLPSYRIGKSLMRSSEGWTMLYIAFVIQINKNDVIDLDRLAPFYERRI